MSEKMVPREPTETMLHCAYQACDDFIDEYGDGDASNLDDGQWNEMMSAAWRAMYDAAPPPPAPPDAPIAVTPGEDAMLNRALFRSATVIDRAPFPADVEAMARELENGREEKPPGCRCIHCRTAETLRAQASEIAALRADGQVMENELHANARVIIALESQLAALRAVPADAELDWLSTRLLNDIEEPLGQEANDAIYALRSQLAETQGEVAKFGPILNAEMYRAEQAERELAACRESVGAMLDWLVSEYQTSGETVRHILLHVPNSGVRG